MRASLPHSGRGAGDDFAAVPLLVPGTVTITTTTLRRLLAAGAAPRVLDVGRGVAVVPNAILVWPDGVWGDPDRMLDGAAHADDRNAGRPLVVMGDGASGWTSYNAARRLVETGHAPVLWYRGGEESWAAAGYPAEDRRTQ